MFMTVFTFHEKRKKNVNSNEKIFSTKVPTKGLIFEDI